MQIALKQIHGNPLQPRGTKVDVADLVESLPVVGLIQPIVVAKNADGYVIIAGHRRFAAAQKLGWTDIECEVADLTDPKFDIARIIAENEVRTSLTGKEKAAGFQTMIDLGWTDDEISKLSGATPDELAAVRKVSTAKRKLVDKMPDQATLEEIAGLAEFEGTDAYKDLLEQVGTNNFAHKLSYQREQRERRARVEAAIKKLSDEGTPYVPRDQTYYGGHYRLDDYRIKMTPKKHAKCKGHCATVSWEGEVTYLCCEPKEHGISPSGTAPKTDESKALDKKKRQMRALWRASAPIRQEFIKGKLKVKKLDTKLVEWAYAWATELSCPAFDGHNVRAKDYTDSTDNKVRFVATCVSEAERALDDWVKYSGAVGELHYHGQAQAYLVVLEAMGYPISDHERATMDGNEYELPQE